MLMLLSASIQVTTVSFAPPKNRPATEGSRPLSDHQNLPIVEPPTTPSRPVATSPPTGFLSAVNLNTDALKVDVTERMRATGPFNPGDIEPVNERPSSSAVLRRMPKSLRVVLID